MKVENNDIGRIYKKFDENDKVKGKKSKETSFSKVLNSEKNEKPAAKVERKDSVEISQENREFEIALDAVKKSPDVRADVVAKIKEQIKNGTFPVDPEKVVEKMIENGDINILLMD